MTPEEKQLLLIDLCARLSYGVKIQFSEKFPEWFAKKYGEGTSVTSFTLDASSIGFVIVNINNDVNDVKPYLRSISSMTKEEKHQLTRYAIIGDGHIAGVDFVDWVERKNVPSYIDWLNAHHFDYRGLIEKGLALEAKEGMYD